ncbi:M24 family metallopeptidase [Chloroflexota bacterium]
MKTDIDRLMAERDLTALIVFGDETPNPHRAYLTGGFTGQATLFKKINEPVIILTNALEAENARQTGLETHVMNDFNLHELWDEYPDDADMRLVKTYERYFARFGFSSGRVGVYGFTNTGTSWETLRLLSTHFPDLEFVGERQATIFGEMVKTKDAAELAIMQDVARRTNEAMQAAWDFIATHRAVDGVVVKGDGSPLTVGDVKRFVRLHLLALDLEDVNGMIFAQGRDGGFPHSHGTDDQPLETGKAIVFDLYPRDMHSGYYHDMTRTWSIEYATPAVERAYGEVMMAFKAVMGELKAGERTKTYQEIALDVLEECGHPTVRSEPGSTVGYIHSLGHGLGMEIHESPSLTHVMDRDEVEIGNVFSVEPGVYYPDKGFGIRIEDSVYIDENGAPQTLTPMHKELVLKLQG